MAWVVLIVVGLLALWVISFVIGFPIALIRARAEGKALEHEIQARQMFALETLAAQQLGRQPLPSVDEELEDEEDEPDLAPVGDIRLLPRDFVLDVLKASEAATEHAPGVFSYGRPELTTEELIEICEIEEDDTAERFYRDYWNEEVERFYNPWTEAQKPSNFQWALDIAKEHGIPLPGEREAE